MLPYSRGLILDNTNNYGIVKTEAVFGFGPTNHNKYVNDSFNSTEPLEWIFERNFEGRSLKEEEEESRAIKIKPIIIPKPDVTPTPKITERKHEKKSKKKLKRKSKGVKKCIFKILKKGDDSSKKNKRGETKNKMTHKKYMIPLMIGLAAAKSVLITVALKALAFMSAKGLMMGFFSTIMASVLSLKGMFDHSHSYQNRKDDTKTQVEIIQVPTKSEDHVYYDEHYRRGDLVPLLPNYKSHSSIPSGQLPYVIAQ